MPKHVKIWLDSLVANGGTPKRDNGASGNYAWSDITWDLSGILPPHRINELLAADSYTFKLEAIAWTNRTQPVTPFLVSLGVANDSLFASRGGQSDAPLALLRDNYTTLSTHDQVGLHTASKGWLTSTRLRVRFSKLDETAFAEWEFGSGASVTNTTTSYVLALTIEY
jgi:hypothetical protein